MCLNDREDVKVSVDQTRYLRSEKEDGMDQSPELSCTGRSDLRRFTRVERKFIKREEMTTGNTVKRDGIVKDTESECLGKFLFVIILVELVLVLSWFWELRHIRFGFRYKQMWFKKFNSPGLDFKHKGY